MEMHLFLVVALSTFSLQLNDPIPEPVSQNNNFYKNRFLALICNKTLRTGDDIYLFTCLFLLKWPIVKVKHKCIYIHMWILFNALLESSTLNWYSTPYHKLQSEVFQKKGHIMI